MAILSAVVAAVVVAEILSVVEAAVEIAVAAVIDALVEVTGVAAVAEDKEIFADAMTEADVTTEVGIDSTNRRILKSKGFKLQFEPTPKTAKSLSKHINETVKAYPVADLARMVSNSRDRYQIRIKSDQNGPALFRCKQDGSVWLSRDEAISNFLRSKKNLSKYYVVEEVDLGAPKGNFSTIAVCGFSGEVLGPPNHHEYQSTVAKVHRERFSNMALERYKSRIEMQTAPHPTLGRKRL